MQEAALVADYDMAVGSSPAATGAWAAHEAMEMEADVTTAEYEMEDAHQPSNEPASDEVEMGEAVPTPAPDVDEEIIDYTETAPPLLEASTSVLSATAPIFAPTPTAPISYDAPPLASSVPRKSLADAPPLPDSDGADDHADAPASAPEGEAVTTAGEGEDGIYDEEPSAAAAQATLSTTTAELSEAMAHEEAQRAQQRSSSTDAHDSARVHRDAREEYAAAAPDDLANSRPPPVRVTYSGQDFVLFSTAHTPSYSAAAPASEEGQATTSKGTVEVGCPKLAAPASVFSESLDLLCEALRVGESLGDFLDDGTELVLSLPQLDLSVREDDVYAREVTLADLHRLHIGAGILGSLHLVVTEAPRFITRYNALASSVGAGDETIVEDDVDNSGTSLHDSEVGYSQFEHGEADGGEEQDAAEADQTFVTVRDGSAEQQEQDGSEAQQEEEERDDQDDDHEEQYQDNAEAVYEEAAADVPVEEGSEEPLDEAAYDEQVEEASHEQQYEGEEACGDVGEEGTTHFERQDEEQDEQLDDNDEAETEARYVSDEAAPNGEAYTTVTEHPVDEEPLIDYDEAVGDEDVLAEHSVEATVETADRAIYEEDAVTVPAHSNGKRALEDSDSVDASDYADALEAKRAKVV